MAAAAASSETDVANLALLRVGAAKIDSIDDTSDWAKTVKHFYIDTRDEICKLLPWSCLITRTALSTSAAAESTFGYKHTLASTVLTVLTVGNDTDKPFAVEGLTLFTNEETGYFKHTAQEATIANWDAILLSCIEVRLASKIAFRITGNIELYAMLYQEFLALLSVAIKLKIVEDTKEANETITMLQQINPAQVLRGRNIISE